MRDIGHARPSDIDQRKEPRLATVDHPLAKVGEVAPTRATGIDHRRHPGAKAKTIGQDAIIPRPLVAVPRRRIGVPVNIDQPRRHIEPGNVDDFASALDGQIGLHRRDQQPGRLLV